MSILSAGPHSPVYHIVRHPRAFALALALSVGLNAAGATNAPLGLFHPDAGRPVIRDFRPADYLGHPQAWYITAGRDGLITFGGQEGIEEFDGSRWSHYAAPTSHVFALAETPDGRLWAGGNDTLGYFAATPEGGRLYHSFNEQLPAEALPWGRTVGALVDGSTVYFSSTHTIARIAADQTTVWPISGRGVPTFHRLGGEIVAHLRGAGFFALTAPELTPLPAPPELSSPARIASTVLPDGRTLVAVSYAGVWLYTPASQSWAPLNAELSELVRQENISSALTLPDCSVAVGTYGHGLLLASPDLNTVRQIDRATGLADNGVMGLALDREGGLWLGLNSGVARLTLSGGTTTFDATNGPTPGTIDAFGRHDGHLYAGTYDGLYRLDAGAEPQRGGRFVRINDQINSIFSLSSYDDHLLIASQTGLYRLLPDDTVELLLPTPTNLIFALVPSDRVPGRFYLAGRTGLTVVQHDPAGWRVVQENQTLGDGRTMVLEPDGTLWIGTYDHGYWRMPGIDTLADDATPAYEHYLSGHGLPDNIVWTTVTPGVGGPVFFSDKGMRRFDPATRTFHAEDRYVLPDGTTPLFSPTATYGSATWGSLFSASTIVASQPLGRFITGADGRQQWHAASPEAMQETTFGGAAILWVDESPAGAALWVRGYNNTVRLDLQAPETAPSPWAARIRSARSEGLSVALPVAGSSLALAYAREPLVFELAAPHYGALDGLTFETRLLGYSDQWSAPSPTPRVSFTNLEGGPFTLEARAIDVTGRISEPARLTFTVAPPWPRSTPAKVAYAGAGLLVLFGLFRWRSRHDERERARLETLVATRTTELATARNEAEAASRAKSDFLASMSHELRTPLNGVIGYAQLLERDPRLAVDQRERVGIVHRSGDHLLRMINDVLDLAKIEAGKLDLHPAPFAVADLMRDLVAAHAAAAATKGLALTLTLAPDLPPWLDGDAGKIRQIADNLVGNAIKFTAEGRVELHAGALAAGSGFTLRVTDTGPGIAAEDHARIFQPFEQARRQRPTVPGTGLGLAISQAIVTRMGGTLSLQAAPGGGSCFEVSLPLVAVAIAATTVAKPVATSYLGPRRHVLIVDDHAVNRSLLVDLLEPLGFSCTAFESGAAALRALADPAQAPPALAIIDVRMAGMDGLELTRALRARPATPTLRIVLTSASVLSFDPAVGRAAGCDDFLPKPFQVETLVELIGRLLNLTWEHRSPDAAPGLSAGKPLGLNRDLRRALREALAAGDLDALRRQIEAAFPTYPNDRDALAGLAQAAGRFDLALLRSWLNEPTSDPAP